MEYLQEQVDDNEDIAVKHEDFLRITSFFH